MNAKDLEFNLELRLAHKRFTIHELEEILWTTPVLWWDDVDTPNIADYNFMLDYKWYDVDIYFLIDRHCKYFITEISVNDQ